MDNDGASSVGGGSYKATSEVSSTGGRKELTAEQKKLLFKARVVMFLILVVFIVCSLFETARLIMCIVLLFGMGIMSCCWEEDSYLASGDAGWSRRVRNIACQTCMIIIPMATSGWMCFIAISMFTQQPLPELLPSELAAIETPPGLAEVLGTPVPTAAEL